MVEPNVTRRRVLQGAGAVGVATLGSTVISAQEGDGQDGQSAAVRVVHASPDAPNVDVRLTPEGGATGDGNATAGGENATDDGNVTGDGNATDGGQDGGDAPSITGVGFGDVTSYTEVGPGTYRVEIVPAEGGLVEDVIGDLFGGGDGDGDDATVLFDDQVDVQAGTTYTVVAFGELARGPVTPSDAGAAGETATEPDDGVGANATAGGGVDDNATDGVGTDDNATDGLGTNATDGVGANETGGVGTNETGGVGTGDGPAAGDVLVEELAFGESQTVEVAAGDYTLAVEAIGAGSVDGVGGETGATETDDIGTTETGGLNDTGGVEANETDDGGTTETETVATDETSGADSDQTGDSERGFQVQVLEDDVSDPGDETARLRVFHAVPDVDAVSISEVSDGESPTEGENGTGGAGANETGGGGVGNDTGGVGNDTGGVGNDTGGVGNDTGGVGNDTDEVGGGGVTNQSEAGGVDASGQQDADVRNASFSADGNTAYSGFAVGYFDLQAAASAGNATGAGNDTGAGNATGGVGQTETPDGNATGTETGDESDAVAEDAEGEAFELVVVEDAQDGERSDGGTGGLFDLAPPVDD